MSAPEAAVKNPTAPPPLYKLRDDAVLVEMETGYSDRRFLLRLENGNAQGTRFIISERLESILAMLDGTRSAPEIAELLSQREGRKVAAEDIEKIVDEFVEPYGLLQNDAAPQEAGSEASGKNSSRSRSFSFMLRLPFLSGERAGRLADRFTFLYRPGFVWAACAFIFLAHVVCYGGFVERPRLGFTAGDILLLYPLAVFTVLFHELGHATAARLYKHKHGDIGFVLYLIFPAFYIDLKDAWELKAKQRAVVDVGGIYFQLLLGSLAFFVFLATGNKHALAVSYAVDAMALISFFPLFKFDGYWLAVDLLGVPNLKFLAPRIVLDALWWTIGRRERVKVLGGIRSLPRRVSLTVYAFVSVAFFSWFYYILAVRAPFILADLFQRAGAIVSGGMDLFVGSLKGLLFDLVFILFFSKLVKNVLLKAGRRLKALEGNKLLRRLARAFARLRGSQWREDGMTLGNNVESERQKP